MQLKTFPNCSNMIDIKSQFKFGNLQVLNTKTIID